MDWLNNLRRPKAEEPPGRSFFYTHDKLANQYFAVIRMEWYLDGKVCAVTESSITIHDKDVQAEFTSILSEALRLGADVCVVCIEDPKALGIHKL